MNDLELTVAVPMLVDPVAAHSLGAVFGMWAFEADGTEPFARDFLMALARALYLYGDDLAVEQHDMYIAFVMWLDGLAGLEGPDDDVE